MFADIGTLQYQQCMLPSCEVAKTLDCMHDAHSVLCYENHAQDCRIKPIEVSDTRTQKDGTGGNNLPLVLHLSAYSFCPGMARRRGGRNRFTEELSSTISTASGDNTPTIVQRETEASDGRP